MILHRYILKEELPPFVLGIGVLTLILLMNQFFLMVWDIIGKGVKPIQIARVLLYSLPFIFVFTIPMGIFIAHLMALGRLNQDFELLALKGCGVHPMKISIVPFMLSLIVTGGVFYLTDRVVPDANFKLRKLLYTIAYEKPTYRIKPGVIFSELPDYDLYVLEVEHKTGHLEGVTIFEKVSPYRTIVAREGYLYSRDSILVLHLIDGEIHTVSENGYQKVTFPKYVLRVSLEAKTKYHGARHRTDSELSLSGIKQRIVEIKHGKGSTEYKRLRVNRLMVEYHKKLALAFSPVVLTVLGLGIALSLRKVGAGLSFGIALPFFIFYYVCLVGGETLGDRGIVAPWLSMWFANIILGVVGVCLFIRNLCR
ncbi:hypothetical protein DRO02_06995 [archaeon]|nr:MAG: hypothetical protein DRO02_06995 [archaeon]